MPIRTLTYQRNLATARRWAPRVLGAVAIGLLPWMVVLGRTLPATIEVRNWNTAWIGLDLLMAAGCAGTAILHARGDQRAGLTAAATATVTLLDAWFDVLTAQPGSPLAQALVCAVAELSLTGYCVVVAHGHLHRQSVAGNPNNGMRSGPNTSTSATIPASIR